MVAELEPSPVTAAHFWRWLLTGAALMLVVGQLEYLDVSLLDISLVKGGVGSHDARLGLTLQLIDFVFGAAYPLYAIVFFSDYFFFQRFERIGGRRVASLWLLGAATLAAGLVLSWLVHAIGLGFAVGVGFGALLWWLQKRHSELLRFPPASLLRAHLWGGFCAGLLLSLRGIAFTGALFPRVPVAASSVMLALAFTPHLLLTWRAMRPVLARGVPATTSNSALVTRLGVTIVVVAVLALAPVVILR